MCLRIRNSHYRVIVKIEGLFHLHQFWLFKKSRLYPMLFVPCLIFFFRMLHHTRHDGSSVCVGKSRVGVPQRIRDTMLRLLSFVRHQLASCQYAFYVNVPGLRKHSLSSCFSIRKTPPLRKTSEWIIEFVNASLTALC